MRLVVPLCTTGKTSVPASGVVTVGSADIAVFAILTPNLDTVHI